MTAARVRGKEHGLGLHQSPHLPWEGPNLVCAYRSETPFCEHPPFLAPLFTLSTQMQREGSTITGQEKELTPCRPFLHLHPLCSLYIWCGQYCSLFNISLAGWQNKRQGIGRESRPGQADSSVLALLGLKGIINFSGATLQTCS